MNERQIDALVDRAKAVFSARELCEHTRRIFNRGESAVQEMVQEIERREA